jgi:hypothetical protein
MNVRHTGTNARSIVCSLVTSSVRRAQHASDRLQNLSIGGLFKAFMPGSARQYLGFLVLAARYIDFALLLRDTHLRNASRIVEQSRRLRMKNPSPKKRPGAREKWVAFAFALIVLVSGVTFAGKIGTAIEMVRTARGLETYRTFWLIEFNWIGFLTLIAGVVVALLIGLGLQLSEHLETRKLMKKYPADKSDRKPSE